MAFLHCVRDVSMFLIRSLTNIIPPRLLRAINLLLCATLFVYLLCLLSVKMLSEELVNRAKRRTRLVHALSCTCLTGVPSMEQIECCRCAFFF